MQFARAAIVHSKWPREVSSWLPESRHPTTWPSQRSFKDELRVRKMAYNCVPVKNRGVPGQPRRLAEHEDAVFAALLASQEQKEEEA